jgi:hypothetical protein
MNMIIHQTITPYFYSLLPTMVIENLEIELFVIIMKKDHLTPIATLDDMMRVVGNNNSSYSTHRM